MVHLSCTLDDDFRSLASWPGSAHVAHMGPYFGAETNHACAEKSNPSTSCISWFMSLIVSAIWSIPLGQSEQRRRRIHCANSGTKISVMN